MILKSINTTVKNKRNAIQLLCKEMPDNGIIYNDCAKLLNNIKVGNFDKSIVYAYKNIDNTQVASIERVKSENKYSYIVKVNISINL
jgi:hypothetical protein